MPRRARRPNHLCTVRSMDFPYFRQYVRSSPTSKQSLDGSYRRHHDDSSVVPWLGGSDHRRLRHRDADARTVRGVCGDCCNPACSTTARRCCPTAGGLRRPAVSSEPEACLSILVLSPDGRYAITTNNGINRPSLTVIDVASWTVKSTMTVDNAWYGLVFHPDGTRLYSAGAAQNNIQEFAYADGTLTRRVRSRCRR